MSSVLLVPVVSDVYMLNSMGDRTPCRTQFLNWRCVVLFLNLVYALRHLM